MNTTIGTGSHVQLRLTSDAVTSSRNYYFTRFVSTALNVASISANTWTYNFAARQNSEGDRGNFPVTGTNKPVRVNCYVWRPGTGKVGTILDGNTNNTVDEITSGTIAAHHVTFSGSAVSSMIAGDRIVLEVWFIISQSSSINSTDDFFYDGTTVNTTDNATVSNHASFIETPQNLTFQAGSTIPVGNTVSHIYNIDGVSTEDLVGSSMMHRYKILPQQATPPEDITAEGFTVFMRVYIPFIHNEALYNKRGVLFSKIDDEQVTHAYIAQIGDDGTIYWIVKDNSREYYLSAPSALNIAATGSPDFADSDFNSQDFFTVSSLVGDLPNPIIYDDLAFTYSFVDHRMQIIDNGIVIADTGDNPESTGLVAWWRMNEGGDIGNNPIEPSTFTKTVFNSAGLNHGTISNATWTQLPDKPHETYLDFDGNNDNVIVSNYTAIQNLSEFTVSFWYYPEAVPTTDGFLVQKNTTTTNRWLVYHQSTGFVRFSLWNNSSTRFDITFNSAFPSLDTWYHIVAKVTLGSTGKIFVNNVKVTGGSNVTGTLDTGTTNLMFGGTSSSNTPTGLIHDVKLWNRELSDAEVETLYNEGHPVSGFPTWQEDPPPPPDIPVPITNPFTEIYHLAKPTTNFTWQTLHKLFTSGFTQFYTNQDGIVVAEKSEPFTPVYTVTGSGGGGGGGSTETVYNAGITSGNHLEFEDGINRAGVRFNSGNAHLGKVVKSVTVRFRRQGSSSGTVSVVVRSSGGTHRRDLGTFSLGSFSSGGTEHSTTINASSNTYAMVADDVVSVEYPSSSSGIELTYSSSGVSGFTSVQSTGGSFSTFSDGGLSNIAMQIDVSGSGGGGGGGVSMFNTVTNGVGGVTVCKAHINSTNASIYNKKITRVKLVLSKVGSPTGTLQVQLRSSNTSAQVNMGSLNVSTQISGTATEHIFTNTNNGLDSGFALPNGGGVAVVYSGGNSSNYVVVSTSGSSEVSNVHVRNHEYNNQPFPFGGFVWNDYTSQDVSGTMETGGFIIPAKNPWFALNGGAVRSVGQKSINSGGTLVGKKITRFKPKLRAVGNPTGTIRCVIRTSAGTEVGHLSAIEANTVGPSSFEEYEFTNILQSRTLATGDMVLIEYTGNAQNHIQVMVEWDETHGGQLGNDQAVTFNGSSYTAIPADMSGLMFTGGSATDPTSRERVGIRVRGTGATNSILHLKKLSKALVWLRKVGTPSPTSNVFLRIRRGSDDSTVANVGQVAVSSITTENQYEFTNSPVSVYAIQLNDRVLVEYPDGDDTNYIQVAITTTDQIDGTNSHLIKYDALWTDYDEITTNDLIMTAHAGGDTFTPTGDEIPPAPPPQYSHDLHVFAGGYPYDYYEDTSIVENWVSTIAPDIRFYRKILTPEELANIYNNRRDRANLPFTQIAVVGFFSLPP